MHISKKWRSTANTSCLDFFYLSSSFVASMIRGNSEGGGEDRLWKDFVKALQEGDKNQVRRILLAPGSPNNGSGRPHSFLTRKIRNSQVSY